MKHGLLTAILYTALCAPLHTLEGMDQISKQDIELARHLPITDSVDKGLRLFARSAIVKELFTSTALIHNDQFSSTEEMYQAAQEFKERYPVERQRALSAMKAVGIPNKEARRVVILHGDDEHGVAAYAGHHKNIKVMALNDLLLSTQSEQNHTLRHEAVHIKYNDQFVNNMAQFIPIFSYAKLLDNRGYSAEKISSALAASVKLSQVDIQAYDENKLHPYRETETPAFMQYQERRAELDAILSTDCIEDPETLSYCSAEREHFDRGYLSKEHLSMIDSLRKNHRKKSAEFGIWKRRTAHQLFNADTLIRKRMDHHQGRLEARKARLDQPRNYA